MSTEQIRNDVEYQIFACLIIKGDLFNTINLDEKYFTHKNILKYLKTLYERYGYLDDKLILTKSQNINNAVNFIIECMQFESTSRNIFGYYKKLKNDYYVNQISLYYKKLMNEEIDYKQFCEQTTLLSNDDTQTEYIIKPNLKLIVIKLNIIRKHIEK